MTKVFNITFNLSFMVWCDGSESKMSGFDRLNIPDCQDMKSWESGLSDFEGLRIHSVSVSKFENLDQLLVSRLENFENPYYEFILWILKIRQAVESII